MFFYAEDGICFFRVKGAYESAVWLWFGELLCRSVGWCVCVCVRACVCVCVCLCLCVCVDRTGVVAGKSVDLGGRRIMKNKEVTT